MTTATSCAFFQNYQEVVNHALKECIPYFGKKNSLRDACEYALLSGGKRFRPAIVLMVARELDKISQRFVLPVALSVELFHTASLIADDLPCMDDDAERRGKPATHIAFGEDVAILATYALIAEGYQGIYRAIEVLRKQYQGPNWDRIGMVALEQAAKSTGTSGATGGQFLDLHPENQSLYSLTEILEKKTASLFELSFVFGWLFGGGGLNSIDQVRRLSYHFGMAFQLADDFGDLEQDSAMKEQTNFALLQGRESAKESFYKEIGAFYRLLKDLKIESEEFIQVGKLLEFRVEEACRRFPEPV